MHGSSEAVLEAGGLTKHFAVGRRGPRLPSNPSRKVRAVDGVDLKLRRGQVTALVGESGSGKSTVARLLAQLTPPTAGEIRLDGRPVSARRGRRFRAYCGRVQLVFQDPFASLNPAHTVRYHLTRALRLHRDSGRGDRLHEVVHALLEDVALTPPSEFLGKLPHELSGGQRQRVAIARALATEPDVLLADEPVSMLDVSIRIGVLNVLRELSQNGRLALLYITHDIASARYFADNIVVMYAGRIVERGDRETITQRPAHPYTQLLIESAPDLLRLHGRQSGQALSQVQPPDRASPESGCSFRFRCSQAMSMCRTRAPALTEVGDEPGHDVSCWLHPPS